MPTFRLATPADDHLPYYSWSLATDVTTCPKWGIIHSILRRYFAANYRSMSLEAGSAMHEVFAACRLWQLLRKQNLPQHFEFHAKRIFGEARFDATWAVAERPNEPRDELLAWTFEILNSGEFYDDPDDGIRTIANMETTTIKYVDTMMEAMNRNPIWVEDKNDATKRIGVEIPFSIVVDETFRYIGTIDGVTDRGFFLDVQDDGEIRLEENKTASRLDETFRRAWMVQAQPVGYMVATMLITGRKVEKFKMVGIKVKQTKSHEDMLTFVEERDEERILQWTKFMHFVHEIVERFKGEPLEAPMFTHSCNRYFRPCGFVDLCAASMADQRDMYAAMETKPYSPSEEALFGAGAADASREDADSSLGLRIGMLADDRSAGVGEGD